MAVKMHRPPQYDVLLVDALNLVYRHQSKLGYLKTDDGRPTGAIFGTLRQLLKLLKDHKPSHVVVAFDGKNGWRKEASADYKANRSKRDDHDDVQLQISALQEFCARAGIAMVQEDRLEADDVIAAMAHQAKAAQQTVLIVSNDHDMDQLISEVVHVYKNKDIRTEWHVDVEYRGLRGLGIAYTLAITGCDTDNVKGVRGFGPAKALKAILEHGDLDAACNAIEKLGAERERLEENLDLVRLDDAKCDTALQDCELRLRESLQNNTDRIKSWLREWQMNSIAKSLGLDLSEEEMLS